jgi:hypothetical protein
MMELYPGYLEDHFNIHKLRCVLPLISPGFLPFDLLRVHYHYGNCCISTLSEVKLGGRHRRYLTTAI